MVGVSFSPEIETGNVRIRLFDTSIRPVLAQMANQAEQVRESIPDLDLSAEGLVDEGEFGGFLAEGASESFVNPLCIHRANRNLQIETTVIFYLIGN